MASEDTVLFNGKPVTFVSGVTLDELRTLPMLDGRTVKATPKSGRRRGGRVVVTYDLATVRRRARERNVQCTN